MPEHIDKQVAAIMGQHRVGDCPLGDPTCPGRYEPQVGRWPCLPPFSTDANADFTVLEWARNFWHGDEMEQFAIQLEKLQDAHGNGFFDTHDGYGWTPRVFYEIGDYSQAAVEAVRCELAKR